MKKNSLQIMDERNRLIRRNMEILSLCKKENRECTPEEDEEMKSNEEEIDKLNEEEKELDEELEKENTDGETPADEETNTNKEEKSMKTLVKEIRSAIENGTKMFTINAENRAATTNQDVISVNNHVTGEAPNQNTSAGVGGNVVETEMQGILEPLYAKSVLTQLGVKWYTGLPQGDISIPVMGKGNVGWAAELAEAGRTANTFTNVTLQPKRLTAFVDISKQLIAQDTIGVEAAIRRDIVNALNDKLEATILGYSAGDTTKPAGMFYSNVLNNATSVSTFAGLCAAEATVENANVYGEMKYLLNPSGKAKLRAMAKSAKSTELVFEGGSVDGVPAVITSNVKDQSTSNPVAVYGDFSNIAVGSWGNIEITVDEYTQAVNGCIRLIVNAYFDFKVLRKEAFAVATLS